MAVPVWAKLLILAFIAGDVSFVRSQSSQQGDGGGDDSVQPCLIVQSQSQHMLGSYVPQCTEDGKYTSQQCHPGTGYCWCVDENGVEVENTSRPPSERPVNCSEVATQTGAAGGSTTPVPTPLPSTAVPPRSCSMAPDAGPCEMVTMRWYFDRETETCKQFAYGGCEGNVNNFRSKHSCEFECPAAGCPAIDCDITCEFGYQVDSNQCNVCLCFDPCSVIDCPSGQSCLVETVDCGATWCPSKIECVDDASGLPSYCYLSADVGTCDNVTARWNFDSESQACTEFTYRGCEGNRNNFKTMAECLMACLNPCPVPMCMSKCTYGYEKGDNGCYTCNCYDPCKGLTCGEEETCQPEKVFCESAPCTAVARCIAVRGNLQELCSLGFDAGDCQTREEKWYYDASSDECRQRTYSSCGGNANQFVTESQCEIACKPAVCQPVRCRLMCPFGFAKDDNGCEVCRCVNPCEGVTCNSTLGELCLPERRSCDESPCPVVGKCFAVRGDLKSKCSLPMEVGLCSSRQSRWHFNLTSSQCEPFNYTGCRGNDNRFETRSACIQQCDPHRCKQVTCRMFCPFGWATDEDGCEFCQCRNPCKDVHCIEGKTCMPERRSCTTSPCPVVGTCLAKRPDLESRCSLPIEVGLCGGRELKWFFNLTSNTCDEFNYTGCRGNDNRFDSVEACIQTCEPNRCAPVTCKMMCPFGWAKDENGCEICQCVNPCEGVSCLEDETCLPERRSCAMSPCPVVGKCFPIRPDLASQCSLAIEVGLCNTPEQRWFFNLTSNTCEAFNYTGCRGNDNRFDSMKECSQTCSSNRCSSVMCMKICPFGFVQDDNGCDICKCVDPCVNVECSNEERCLTERKSCEKNPCPVVGKCYARRPDLEDRCSLAIDVGLCDSRKLKWLFNVTSNKCEAFNYTGCDGNDNRFESMTECRLMCEPKRCDPVTCRMACPFGWAKDENGCEICQCLNPCQGVTCLEEERCLPERRACAMSPCPVVGTCFRIRPDLATQCSLAIEVGLCNSLELRWFFNLTSSKCEVFNYTGCRGNHNRFDSVSECMETCDPNGCPLVTCKMMCPFGWAQDDKGCDICQCVNPCKDVECPEEKRCLPERKQCDNSPCPVEGNCFAERPDLEPRCSLAIEVGLCDSREQKWLFNVTSNKCEAFNYTGCRGNDNRFDSIAECRQTCDPNRCSPVKCRMLCPYGWAQDEEGCDICKCANPCKDVSCPDTTRCLPERTYCDNSPCPAVGKCFATRPDLEPHCSLAIETGLCSLRQLKWFFNVTSNTCDTFNYTGCRGNGNRFESVSSCMATCDPYGCQPVTCKMLCPYGWAQDEDGCDICKCANPCKDVSCPDTTRCLPERTYCDKSPCPAVGKCFATRPDMESHCSLAVETGLCSSRELKWFFNVTSDNCETFNYTGCRGNGNRFESQAACMQSCKPDACETVQCRMFCPYGFITDERGCEICRCVNPCFGITCEDGKRCFPERRRCDKPAPCPVVSKCIAVRTDIPASCSVPLDFGLCGDRLSRWYFNTQADKCKEFVYSGCRGNVNNFETEVRCATTCPSSFCEPVSCELQCEFGFDRKYDGCVLCSCRDPCKLKTCGDNANCEVVQGNCSGSACESVARCVPHVITVCPKLECQRFCAYGFDTDNYGCDICSCYDPCKLINCGERFLCKVKTCVKNDPWCHPYGVCVPNHVESLTTLAPDRLREKPGLCPPEEMNMGICAEMCSYDVSCPGTQKCCSNGCGHVCMHSVRTTKNYTATTATPVKVKLGQCPNIDSDSASICMEGCSDDGSCPADQKCCSNGCGHLCMDPDTDERVCADGSAKRNCTNVCAYASCDALGGTTDAYTCKADPCDRCRFVFYKQESQEEICSGWLCAAMNESWSCDEQTMCASDPICKWWPEAKCVDDACNCDVKFIRRFESNRPVDDCDKEMTACRRIRNREQSKWFAMSGMWEPECDDAGYFKPVQHIYNGAYWCVDPLGNTIEDTRGDKFLRDTDCWDGNVTSVIGSLRLDADYETLTEDDGVFVYSMEWQLADAMMVDGKQMAVFKVEPGSVVMSFEVSANETSLLRLLSRADRFERLVHADKLHLEYKERPLSIVDGGSFRFSFVYAEKPKPVWTSGVIIAVTIVSCAVLLGVMLVGMVCLACRRKEVYMIEEKTGAIPAFENPRYLSTEDLKERL